MEKISSLQDIMNYYYFVMIAFFCLTVINMVVTSGVREWKKAGVKFAIIEICVFLAFASHFMFLGVLADNNAEIKILDIQMILLGLSNVFVLAKGFISIRRK